MVAQILVETQRIDHLPFHLLTYIVVIARIAHPQALTTMIDFVQGFIVHQGQHLCQDWSAFHIFYRKFPFFLLTRLQLITEHVPLELQSALWIFLVQGDYLRMRLSVLDEEEQQGDTFTIRLLIRHLKGSELV